MVWTSSQKLETQLTDGNTPTVEDLDRVFKSYSEDVLDYQCSTSVKVRHAAIR